MSSDALRQRFETTRRMYPGFRIDVMGDTDRFRAEAHIPGFKIESSAASFEDAVADTLDQIDGHSHACAMGKATCLQPALRAGKI